VAESKVLLTINLVHGIEIQAKGRVKNRTWNVKTALKQ
jgi:hypothetical protein